MRLGPDLALFRLAVAAAVLLFRQLGLAGGGFLFRLAPLVHRRVAGAGLALPACCTSSAFCALADRAVMVSLSDLVF
jgi:hypothetical protein